MATAIGTRAGPIADAIACDARNRAPDMTCSRRPVTRS